MLFLDFFTGKGENGRNFGEFMLFFAFSLSSLGFLAYFLGVFLLVFFDFREKQVLSGVFLRLFSIFGGIIAFFICSFSSLAFDFLQSKKRQFLSEIMMKTKYMENCSCFFIFCFLRVKNTNTAIFTKRFSASIAKIALKISGKNVIIRKIY